MSSSPPSSAFDLEALNAAFCELIPHNLALGLTLRRIDPGTATAYLHLPWHERLVGNPETRTPHGGVVTTIIDSACGACVYLRLNAPIPIATLDLRVDSLKPATPGRDLWARAECYRATRNIAFVRAVAYHDEADPIASAAGTFMISTKGEVFSEANLRALKP